MIKKFNSFNENQSFVTEDGKNLVERVKDSYPSLLRHYAREMGQFSFTKNELEQQLPAVLSWMEENVGWGLIYSEESFILYEVNP